MKVRASVIAESQSLFPVLTSVVGMLKSWVILLMD